MSEAKRPIKVFLCHASADKPTVRELYLRLKKDGVDAWLDEENLFPGQDWRDVIEETVRTSDIVLVCLSSQSITKEGFVQKEIRIALDKADEKPQDTIFVIPARLEECIVPKRLAGLHWVDLFEDAGYDKLLKALRAPTPFSFSRESSIKNLSKRATISAFIIIGIVVTFLSAVYKIGVSATPTPTIEASETVITPSTVPTITPTDIILSPQPTFTSVSVTNMPLPTFTPVPVAIGKDWMAGCISSLWRTYPSDIQTIERGDGCWKEPLYVFSAENGDLDFFAERGKGSTEIFGLFAPLPENGTVKFTVRIRRLVNVDLWMGIFPEPDVASQGFLLTIPNGNVTSRVIVQKDPFTYETIQGTQLLNQENGYSISFTFTTLSASGSVNPYVFVWNPVSIPSAQKWLFLGYKGFIGSYHIDGTFLSFELKE